MTRDAFRTMLALVGLVLGGCSGGGGKSDPSDAGNDGGRVDAPHAADAGDGSLGSDVSDAPTGADGGPDATGDAPGDAPTTTTDGGPDAAGDAPGDAPGSTDGSDAAVDGLTGDASTGDASTDAPVTPAAPYPYLVSGTRLRVNYVQGTDGTVVQTGFHDTELDADCSFSQDASGATRCLPGGNGQVLFLDDACKNPVVELDSCAAPSSWASLYTASGNETYKVGAPIATPPAVWRFDGDTAQPCVPQTLSSVTFASAALQPASTFVAATSVAETRPGARLGARYYVGADGSKARSVFTDAAFGGPCQTYRSTDGVTRCMPLSIPFAGTAVFADAGCTQQVARFTSGSTPPRYVRALRPSTGQTCGTFWTVREVQDVYQGELWGGSSCMSVAQASASTAYRLGPDLAATMLVAVATELRGGGTRLGGFGLRGADGSIFEPSGRTLVDTRFAELCELMPAAGGGLRCFPYDYGILGYTDAACQAPAHAFPDQSCTLPGAAAIHRSSFANGACGQRSVEKVIARGAPFTSLYTDAGDGTTCMPVAGVSTGGFLDGADVPLSEFVAGEIRRE